MFCTQCNRDTGDDVARHVREPTLWRTCQDGVRMTGHSKTTAYAANCRKCRERVRLEARARREARREGCETESSCEETAAP